MKSFLKKSQERCALFRKRILDISQQVQAIHIGGSYSSIEIIDCIYNGLMNKDIHGEGKDIFILSKGHAGIAQYVVLESLHIINSNDLADYSLFDGKFSVHPDIKNPGISASTGSLGHGLGIATGIAYAHKNIFKTDIIVYVVISDGEMQEGSTWESLMMAANLNLKNLVIILDHNKFQSFRRALDHHPALYPILDKVKAFGYEVDEVDGHNSMEIYDSIKHRDGKKPLFVIADTIKGKGVSYMENNPIWHYRSPSKKEYAIAISELNKGLE